MCEVKRFCKLSKGGIAAGLEKNNAGFYLLELKLVLMDRFQN